MGSGALRSLCLALALATWGCGGGPSGPGPVDGGRDAGGGAARPDGGLRLNANDVAILYALTDAGSAPLVAMREAGHTLLEEASFKLLGAQTSGVPYLVEAPGRDMLYPLLRVSSIRVDPCADEKEPALAVGCRRQLRLAVQVYEPSLHSFGDASLHLFYALDEARLIAVLKRLRDLQSPLDAPLGVHPALASEGPGGPTAIRLRELLRGCCSEANLVRLTLMATGRSGNNWFFHRLDRQADGGLQHVDSESGGFTELSRDPALRDGVPFGTGFPDALLTTPSLDALDAGALRAAVDALRALENPRLTVADQSRCDACHVAGTTLNYVLARRGPLGSLPSEYVRRLQVSPGLEPGLSNLHAFSYFGDQPTVSARAANEVERVLEYLDSEPFWRSLSEQGRAELSR